MIDLRAFQPDPVTAATLRLAGQLRPAVAPYQGIIVQGEHRVPRTAPTLCVDCQRPVLVFDLADGPAAYYLDDEPTIFGLQLFPHTPEACRARFEFGP